MFDSLSIAMLRAAALGTALLLCACGGAPAVPERGVVESNVDTWRFRRYQKLLDVEIWVRDNPAVGHTATYVRKDAEREGRIESDTLASVFVTRYQDNRGLLRGLVEFVKRLDDEGSYEVEVESLGDALVLSVRGQGESWALWQADKHIIKVGGRGRETLPEELVAAYAERYPSRLSGDILDRPLEELEPTTEAPGPAADDDLPGDSPAPDWDAYQSGEIEVGGDDDSDSGDADDDPGSDAP